MSDFVTGAIFVSLLVLLVGLLLLQRRHRVKRTVSPLTSLVGVATDLGEDVEQLLIKEDHPGLCPACGSAGLGTLYFEYRRISFMSLLGFVVEKRYFRLCGECGNDEEFERRAIEAQVVEIPRIPSTNALFLKIVGFTLLGFILLAIIIEVAS